MVAAISSRRKLNRATASVVEALEDRRLFAVDLPGFGEYQIRDLQFISGVAGNTSSFNLEVIPGYDDRPFTAKSLEDALKQAVIGDVTDVTQNVVYNFPSKLWAWPHNGSAPTGSAFELTYIDDTSVSGIDKGQWVLAYDDAGTGGAKDYDFNDGYIKFNWAPKALPSQICGVNTGADVLEGGVTAYNGKITHSQTSLGSGALGGLDQSISWSQFNMLSPQNTNGNGVVTNSLPYVTQLAGDKSVALVSSSTGAEYFDRIGTGNTYTAAFDIKDEFTAVNNGAIDFSGSNKYGTMGTYNFGSTFTIGGWVYLPSGVNGSRTIMGNKNSGTTTSGFSLYVSSSGSNDGKLRLDTSNGTSTTTATTAAGAVPTDIWTYVSVSVDKTNGQARLYINGVDATTSSAIRTDFGTNQAARIAATNNGSLYFKGSMDDLRVYSRNLSASEVLSVAQGTASPSNLKDRWYFNEGSGSTAASAVSGGTTISLVNGPTWTNRRYYQVTRPDGSTMTFQGYENVNLGGMLSSMIDAAGNVTQVVSYNAAGNATELLRGSLSSSEQESWVYAYNTTGSNAGKLASVTLRRRDSISSSYATVRTVAYTYYDGTTSNGNLGDMRSVVVTDYQGGSGVTVDTSFYRWYKTDSSTSYVGGLKYFFDNESYARLQQATGNAFGVSDSVAAPYATNYYEYDSSRRVTKEIAQGAGCSSCTGGQGTYTFSYSSSSNAEGYNSWRYKTVQTLPDGNQNTVYTNSYGQAMLVVYQDTTTSQQWLTYTQYDGQGRTILTADPSAVTGFDETKADLVNFVSGNAQYLADSSGLIHVTNYGTSTTATSTTAGDAVGYEKAEKLLHGETATPIVQSAMTYFKRTAGSNTVFPVAATTVYANDDGTGGRTTTDAYTWVSGTTQMASSTTTLPSVSVARNGPGSSDTYSSTFDTFGRTIWTKDGGGYLTYTAYDQKTGGVTMSVADADPSLISGAPVSAPSRGSGLPTALHLVTTYSVDSLGRTTKETDPNGNVTYTVYNDANHETRTYRGWNATTGTTTGPIELTREDQPGSYTESLTMSATPAVSGSSGSYKPTGTEAVSNIESLSRTLTSAGGQVTESRAYFNLSGLTYTTAFNLGTSGTNYYATTYAYDQRGRLKRTQSPTGTIQWTLYDGLNRTTSSWIGTNDTGAVNGDPTGGGASGNNMQKVSENVYDTGGVGDGNLTQMTQYPNDGSANRVSQMYYDWRDRQVASKSAVESSESTSDNAHFISYTDYDNLGEVVATSLYDGDGVTVTSTNEVPDKPSSSLLRAYGTSAFDEQGRVYNSRTFSVDPATGAVGSTWIATNNFYDRRGNLVKSATSSQAKQKMQYDGAGRLTKSYTTDGGGDAYAGNSGAWADAQNVTGDIVLEQSETTYDADGNAILSTTRQRFHDATDTGELGNPSSTSGTAKARVSYGAMYYDAATRMTDQVDVGTNGGSAYTRPSTVPTRSDSVLVNSVSYDSAGRAKDTTDPRGIVSRTLYDALGRTTKTIANYVDGTPSNADDQTTSYTYDGDGHALTLKAELPGSTFQETKYIYGATTSRGDGINSNDILVATQYPDLSTGSASSGQQESYTSNAVGERTSYTDRNGTVHAYSYDVLGRQTTDAVTTLGSGVDGAVRRLGTEFDTQGNAYKFTSYDAATGGSVVNQVQRVFNGLGQLTTEYQATSGSVNTSSTPKVQYGYDSLSNGARMTSMTYPNGRVLTYNYASGLNSAISRLSSISDSSTTLESYSYLGAGTVVARNHPESGINLTYIGTGPGDGGDQYVGLDRFGRVDDQNWKNSSGTSVDDYTYTYDRNSNVTLKSNILNSSLDEAYMYDNLNRLTNVQRNSVDHQTWSLDALGNSNSVITDSVTETRTHNGQNMLISMNSTALSYDNNGNQTTDETGKTLVFDAWNRFKEAKSGSTSLIVYGFDALGRRVNEGSISVYYTAARQEIEDRDASGMTTFQLVRSPVYVNAFIERDRDTDSNGTLDERMYYLQDANFNVTGLGNLSGGIDQRYLYDSYGHQIVLSSSWIVTTEGYANPFGWQGGKANVATGYIHFDWRELNTAQFRWIQQDSAGYVDGRNLYAPLLLNPYSFVDPEGRESDLASELKKQTIKAGIDLMKKSPNELLSRLGSIANGVTQVQKAGKELAKVIDEVTNVWVMLSSEDKKAQRTAMEALVKTVGEEFVKETIKYAAELAGSKLGGFYAAIALDSIKAGNAIGQFIAGVANDAFFVKIGDQATNDPKLTIGTLLFEEDAAGCGLWAYKDSERKIYLHKPEIPKDFWGNVAQIIGFTDRQYKWVQYMRAG